MSYAVQVHDENLGWASIFTGARGECFGFLWCFRNNTLAPRRAVRMVSFPKSSNLRVIEEHAAVEDVSIGQVAGFPSPEQYRRAAARAIETAEKLEAHEKRREERKSRAKRGGE